VRQLIVPFVQAADDAAADRASGDLPVDASGRSRNVLVDTQKPAELAAKLKFILPEEGQGKDGLLAGIEKVLRYSVNTWDQGFMDKLYASNTPVIAFAPHAPFRMHRAHCRRWASSQILCCPS